jgi:putative SOS response-associated peptidase YedK
MVVLLRPEDYGAWLNAPAEKTMDFMRQCPPSDLVVAAQPEPGPAAETP